MQVRYRGTVTTPPVFFSSKHTHRTHEQFDVRAADGSTFRVVDNVTLAPRVPVQPGDTVTVQGELIRLKHGTPLVHWTHHDPGGHHPDGFVALAGRIYA
ncbi:MAG: DUF3465 domain-containing protein [Candidatus Eremiobacteraeota bacterium]|nr:DUF3465 domain-containing protein [Candidatus Eremiobacteraeota bacterium]MBV8644104.1 DUF3465 domain-containing protein [Candidatus Eremiobacteraeota bacterium]